MPNDCTNIITIKFEKENSLLDFVNDRLKNSSYLEPNIIKQGSLGIMVSITTAWGPNTNWLESLLVDYPDCWVKNEWHEEGGLAGIWVGYMDNNEKKIKTMVWEDLSIEDEYYIFK